MDQKHNVCLYMPPLSTIRTWKEMVDYCVQHGITKLETLNILDLATPDLDLARELKAYANEKGITFPCVSVGIDLVGEDRKEAIETVKGYADVANILGSPYLHHTLCLNFSDPAYIAQNKETFFRLGLESAREVFDYAATLGIRTIFEDQGFVFNGRDTFRRFLAEVDRNVGVVADFGNIQFVDENVEDFIPAFADRIVHVHAKDYLVSSTPLPNAYRTRGGNYLQGCRIGEGSVHVEAAFQTLQSIGYKGIVALEGDPIGPDEEAAFCHNLETVRHYMEHYL